MADDMFLRLDNVTGESLDSSHTDEIDVIHWSWSLHQNGTAHHGGGAGSGKVQISDISITKYVDKATATLIRMCCDGTHIDTGRITVRKAGSSPLEYVVIDLKQVMITNVNTGGSPANNRLTEHVTLHFGSFEYKYQKQKSDGGPDGGPATIKWDIAKNKAI